MDVDSIYSLYKTEFKAYALKDVLFNSLVNGKFYPYELAAIKDPSYPVANFRLNGGNEYSPSITIYTNVWVHSIKHFSEAYTVYNRLRNRLHDSNLLSATFMSNILESMPPVSFYDKYSRVYSLMAKYSSKVIILNSIT